MSALTPKACPVCRADAVITNRTGVTAGYGIKCVSDACGIESRKGTREQLREIVAHWNQASMETVGPRLNMDTVDYMALKAKYDALVSGETSASLSSQLHLAMTTSQKYKTKVAEQKIELNAALDKSAQYAVQLGQLTAAYRYLMQLTEDCKKHISSAIDESPFWSKRRIRDAVANWKRFYQNRLPANKYPAVPVLNDKPADPGKNPPKAHPFDSLDHKAQMQRVLHDYENTSA